MSETIRDYIKRRLLWSLGLLAGGGALGMACALIKPESKAFFVGLALLVGSGFIAIKCPRCGYRFDYSFRTPPVRVILGTVDKCPECGVALDEPL